MSVAYSGMYTNNLYNPAKRYHLNTGSSAYLPAGFQKSKSLSDAELREIAAGIEHEAVKGYTQLNKDHLLQALCTALSISTYEHHRAKITGKARIKEKIKELKILRNSLNPLLLAKTINIKLEYIFRLANHKRHYKTQNYPNLTRIEKDALHEISKIFPGLKILQNKPSPKLHS